MWDKKQDKCSKIRKHQKGDQEKGASEVGNQKCGILEGKKMFEQDIKCH